MSRMFSMQTLNRCTIDWSACGHSLLHYHERRTSEGQAQLLLAVLGPIGRNSN